MTISNIYIPWFLASFPGYDWIIDAILKRILQKGPQNKWGIHSSEIRLVGAVSWGAERRQPRFLAGRSGCRRRGSAAHFPRERRRGGAPDEEVVGAVQMFSKVDREGSISEPWQSGGGAGKMPQAEQLIKNQNNDQQVSNIPHNEN